MFPLVPLVTALLATILPEHGRQGSRQNCDRSKEHRQPQNKFPATDRIPLRVRVDEEEQDDSQQKEARGATHGLGRAAALDVLSTTLRTHQTIGSFHRSSGSGWLLFLKSRVVEREKSAGFGFESKPAEKEVVF